MTWVWILLGWFIACLIVAPLLGRHFAEIDEDWP